MRPDRADLRADALAGVPAAVSSVPDGLASAVLVGVNPIHGLAAAMAGPTVGGLLTSSSLVVVTLTTASALAAGSAVEGVPADDRAAALLLVTLLAGGLMIVAAWARLGRYTRFVSHSVMVGFLTGVAVNILFGQLPNLTGAERTDGQVAVTRGIDVLLHPGRWDLPSLASGLVGLALVAGLARTRLAPVGTLLALVVPTVACALLDASSVAQVSDVAAIPEGLPLPVVPDLGLLDLSVVGGAFAVAAVVLVQGAGVAETVPEPDGRPGDTDGDFAAQGVANLASGALGGMPVGGSIGQTVLAKAAGARTRWAGIASGVWLLVVVVVLGSTLGHVVLPPVAGVLVYASARAIRLREAGMVLRTGTISRIAILSTFAATLLVPVASAVGLGVVVSLLLQIDREALDLKVVELTFDGDGTTVEAPAPARLAARRVTLLDVYGSLFYAGARTLEARLPDPAGVDEPVVVLRLRGRTVLGATSFLVLGRYAERLAAAGGRLYLSGVDPHVLRQLARSGRHRVDGPIRIYEATSVLGASSHKAVDDAEAWLLHHEG